MDGLPRPRGARRLHDVSDAVARGIHVIDADIQDEQCGLSDRYAVGAQIGGRTELSCASAASAGRTELSCASAASAGCGRFPRRCTPR